MFIEVILNNQVFHRFEVPDVFLQDVPGNTELENFNMREAIIKHSIEQVKRNHVYRNAENVHIQLAFESKMNQPLFQHEHKI